VRRPVEAPSSRPVAQEHDAGAKGLALQSTQGYTATIHTPNGNFHDEGTSDVSVSVNELGAARLTESFTSSLAEPVLIAPTSKDQWKTGGWKSFGTAFKNQGDCVCFVASGGKNTPTG
jgi:hypothetical protein